jgi:hypothetical protein
MYLQICIYQNHTNEELPLYKHEQLVSCFCIFHVKRFLNSHLSDSILRKYPCHLNCSVCICRNFHIQFVAWDLGSILPNDGSSILTTKVEFFIHLQVCVSTDVLFPCFLPDVILLGFDSSFGLHTYMCIVLLTYWMSGLKFIWQLVVVIVPVCFPRMVTVCTHKSELCLWVVWYIWLHYLRVAFNVQSNLAIRTSV